MALTTSYLVVIKNVKPFFDSLLTAKAPSTFTQKFVEGLGFTSTNDRLFTPLLRSLGFLDANSVPTERYFRFLDQSESKKVLAEAIEEAYGDLFDVNIKAYEMPVSEVKNKLRTLTQGKHSDKVVSLMASTFKALAEYADWNGKMSQNVLENIPKNVEKDNNQPKIEEEIKIPKEDIVEDGENKNKPTQFHYNIQIHLPESRDESVYDVIFKSLKRHLL